MNHIKKFNESIGIEELPMDEQPRFTMKQLEAAFMSARIIFDEKGRVPFVPTIEGAGYEARFKDFKDWFISELGSSNRDIAPNYQFRDGDKWPQFHFKK